MNIFYPADSTRHSKRIGRRFSGLIILALLIVGCNRPSKEQIILTPDQFATPFLTPIATSPSSNCVSAVTLTPAQTEGPYFKAGSPERAALIEAKTTGTALILSGYVLTPDCKPIAHALLDFWQADANGNYDNSGYTLRGHQYTDANGRYELTTIVPGLYPGRTEHIHVKVQAPNGPVLTSQLYFPGVTQNENDGIFDPKLVMALQQNGAGVTAVFNFVVNEP